MRGLEFAIVFLVAESNRQPLAFDVIKANFSIALDLYQG